MKARIDEYLAETARLLDRLDRAAIARAAELLLECYWRQGRVWTLGNGGSASTAQHFACDLAKFVIPPGGRPFDTRCLTDNVSLYTAWANDAAREDVFANQMRGLLRPEDVVILISVHGGKGFSGDLVERSALRPRGRSGDDLAGRLRRRGVAPGVDLLDPRPGRIDAADRRDAPGDRAPVDGSAPPASGGRGNP